MQTITVTPDSPLSDQVLDAARELRQLADQISDFGPQMGPEGWKSISVALQQIAWNSLFVSSAIDALVHPMGGCLLKSGDIERSGVMRQIENMHLVVDYLQRSVRFVMDSLDRIEDGCPEASESIHQLASRLVEVADECRHP